jgi:hypothetical protein
MMTYKEKLLNSQISNVDYILETLSETNWYLAEESDRKFFANSVFDFMAKKFDLIENNNLIKIMSSLYYIEINDVNLCLNLMKKSIELNKAIITPYNVKFDIFNEQEKINYVKILNHINYKDFSYFKYRLSESNGKEILCNIYKDYYFNDSKNCNNTIKPSENFNLFILESNPILFIKNLNIDESEKINKLKKFSDEDESGIYLSSFFRLIKNNEIKFNDLNIIDNIIDKISFPKSDYYKKNNIIDFFSILDNKEIIDYTSKKIINSVDIKKNLLNILTEKISLPKDHEIKGFKEKVGKHKNMNFLQYLIFDQPNIFITELCKRDKDFMKAFNNCILEDINGFNYENSPLDLAIQNKIPNITIENLYINKVINNEIKPGLKDKVCAFLFKSIKECELTQQNRYSSLLNAVALVPPNLFNKYFNYYRDKLYDNKLNDLEIIKNMLNVKHSLEQNDTKIDKCKLKI